MDIVERLRLEIGGYTDDYLEKAEVDMKEAADEIERLRQQNEKFGKALQKIAVSGSDEGAWIIAYKAIMETMWGL